MLMQNRTHRLATRRHTSTVGDFSRSTGVCLANSQDFPSRLAAEYTMRLDIESFE